MSFRVIGGERDDDVDPEWAACYLITRIREEPEALRNSFGEPLTDEEQQSLVKWVQWRRGGTMAWPCGWWWWWWWQHPPVDARGPLAPLEVGD